MVVLVLLSLPLETYLYGVVPAEVYPSWPIEALKAQAVLARTYVKWRLANPRGVEFTLHGDERDQVYDKALVNPSTSRAVDLTAGEYLVDENGDARLVQYVDKCGQTWCPYCQGEPGHKTKDNPDGIWEGRVCQFGMKKLADEGLDYRKIIEYYVNDAVFAKEEE